MQGSSPREKQFLRQIIQQFFLHQNFIWKTSANFDSNTFDCQFQDLYLGLNCSCQVFVSYHSDGSVGGFAHNIFALELLFDISRVFGTVSFCSLELICKIDGFPWSAVSAWLSPKQRSCSECD